MTPEERSKYIAYRLGRAEETLAEARLLAEAGRLLGAVNRIYYAMFYAVNALALSRGYSTASHNQLRGFFNREFVKTAVLSTELGKAYGVAYDSRTKGDYDDMATFEPDQVDRMLIDASEFLTATARLLNMNPVPAGGLNPEPGEPRILP